MNIELTADQAAAFQRGEKITITPPPPQDPVITTALYINEGGMVKLVRERDGEPYEQRVLVWGRRFDGMYEPAEYTEGSSKFYGITRGHLKGHRRIGLP